MDSTIISGSYYDMGYKLGSRLTSLFEPPVPSPAKRNLTRQCSEIARQHIPDLLDEIRGFCDGGGYDVEAMEAFLLVLGYEYFHNPNEGCTVFGVTGDLTDSGFPVFARNYDWDASFQPLCSATCRHPSDRLRSISFSDHMIGCYGGMNESGLAAAILMAGDFEGPWLPGIRVSLSSRWILDHCITTEEAVTFLENIPHVRGQIFMLADKSGHMARVETSPPRVHVTYAQHGFLLSTNHYQADTLKNRSNPALITANSRSRFEKVEDFIKNRGKKLSMQDVMTFLGSHEKGVCNHFKAGDMDISTIYSWIAEISGDPNPIQIWAAAGPPCKNRYEKLSYFF